jgi:hypothetical protein
MPSTQSPAAPAQPGAMGGQVPPNPPYQGAPDYYRQDQVSTNCNLRKIQTWKKLFS